MRDGFIFYESFRDAMRGLPPETQLLLYNSIADYALYDAEPDFSGDGVARGFFTLVRAQIDANNRKRENGSRGGRPPKATEQEPSGALEETGEKPTGNQTETKAEPNGNQTETKAEPNGNQAVTETEPKEKEKAKANVKANAKEKECRTEAPRRFTKPTADEIRAYCRERGNAVDPQRFFDFYEAKGWRVGNQPMKDWRAAVRTWEGRDSARPRDQAGGYAKKGARPAIVQHDFTDGDLAHLLVDLDADPPDGRKEAG